MDPEITKQRVTATFNLVSEGYLHRASRFFSLAADVLVDLLKPQVDWRVLDVATGTGVVSTSVAPQITPGRVHAIDLSEGMLREQEKAIERLGYDNIDLHVMDAEHLEYRKGYFDAVVCGFGLFFLTDMETGLREWVRVTKPGGTILFTSFARNAFQPLTKLFLDRLEVFGMEIPKDRTKMGWYPLSSEQQGMELMHRTGLGSIEVISKQLGYYLDSSDDWWDVCWNAGYRSFLEQLGESSLEEFRRQHLAEIDALKTDQGIWMDVEVLFFKGTKPLTSNQLATTGARAIS